MLNLFINRLRPDERLLLIESRQGYEGSQTQPPIGSSGVRVAFHGIQGGRR